MADSENSRTLPAITPRNFLTATERFLQRATAGGADADAALVKWGPWLAAHRECDRLCSKQQQLETKMFRTVRSPQVEISIPDRACPAIAMTAEEIDSWLTGEEFAERRADAKAQLEARRREWDAVDSVVGYSLVKQAEDAAAALEYRLAQELWATPASSTVAAIAKLHSIIWHGTPQPNADEFPWPQIRSVLTDLLRATSTLAVPVLTPEETSPAHTECGCDRK
ncbi:hypothetical protein MRS76_08055 [Rhizobiaceae bacterium n13]|uniref:Uncharacterized protein n=1 Tax=Ferirhizobium litorale TaxID=2927786 RepID=A0AAE3QBL8_9HYPH|nr:hypothetical protein [Fererhizobium litorale]MDI7861906.1 hypothetical protein [Fererhizobium litorale]MDI7922822.1 hypothetical protein [Fererhizobium litorale]